MPGSAEMPRLQADSFVVDFGKAFSGELVRRTVTLHATAPGEAEFTLGTPAVPGFVIAEVRAMGVGATSLPSTGATTAARRDNTMAVRKVEQRLTAPPWKMRFGEPAELQVDVVYAPKFDAFINMAGVKSTQLNARVRNVRGEGMGVPFELRAQFEGLRLGVSVAVKTPEIYVRMPNRYDPTKPVDALEPSAITLSVANLSGASLPVRIQGGVLPRGVSANPVELTLKKDETRDVSIPLQLVPQHGSDGGAGTLLVQAAGRRSESGLQFVKVVERSFEAKGENWSVGVLLERDGSMHLFAACWLKFPQTRHDCRFRLNAGSGVARAIVLSADTGKTAGCYYSRATIGSGKSPTAQEIVAAGQAPMEALLSVDGKSQPGPDTFYERHALVPVKSVEYHWGCTEYLAGFRAPGYGNVR
ncbi:MAG: hypothetical protein U5L03_01295 [Burkholderiaceae bacterium]|nr:hypothetical protein [Burkholderiaceae bacterium]